MFANCTVVTSYNILEIECARGCLQSNDKISVWSWVEKSLTGSVKWVIEWTFAKHGDDGRLNSPAMIEFASCMVHFAQVLPKLTMPSINRLSQSHTPFSLIRSRICSFAFCKVTPECDVDSKAPLVEIKYGIQIQSAMHLVKLKSSVKSGRTCQS